MGTIQTAGYLVPTNRFLRSAEFCFFFNMLNLLLLCLMAISSPANSMNLFGLDPIGVNFCCGEDETLVVRRTNPDKRVAECVSNGVGGKGSSLEGKQVWVGGEADGEMKSLKLLEVKKPDCQRGLVLTTVRVNKTDSQQEENSTIPIFPFAHDEVTLQGGLMPSEGNVYVRGRPVCDDSWGQNEADVVCRSLGYSGGSATTNSRFGNAPGGDFGMDDVKCQGYEEKLTDCQYASYDDCEASEAAGVVCEDGGSGATGGVLTSDGELLFSRDGRGLKINFHLNGTNFDFKVNFTSVDGGEQESEKSLARLEAGDFCLVQGYTVSSRYDSDDYDELLALSCDACSEQATCSYAKKLFNEVDWRGEGEIQEKGSFHKMIVAAGDANGDSVVDFDEWFTKLKSYVTAAFEALDDNKDGSILNESKEGNLLTSIPYQFFEELIDQTFDFFDSNNDGAISLEDDIFFDIFRDRNGDRKITLSEALGTNLISLTAPIYNFYNKLDRDTDERLTKAEALDFLSKLFTLINTDDSDCKIDVDELLQLLAVLEVPWDHQLAVKMVLDQELSLVSHLLKNLVERADKEEDGEVTIEEILTFADFEFIEKSFLAVPQLGYPGSLGYLMSAGCSRGCGREEREAVVAMWFTALQNLVEMPIFYSAGDASHSCANAE